MNFRVLKSVYPSECVIKAASLFVEKAYIHFDEDDQYWLVELVPKVNAEDDKLSGEFENELLAEAVRFSVYKRTKNIREIILARAVSSSIINTEDHDSFNVVQEETSEIELNGILTDWFDKNEDKNY